LKHGINSSANERGLVTEKQVLNWMKREDGFVNLYDDCILIILLPFCLKRVAIKKMVILGVGYSVRGAYAESSNFVDKFNENII
jgi:hypothetical protein